MIRAVVDTNIWISALIFGGLPQYFVSLALQGRFQLLTSSTLLDELEEKLRIKFNRTDMLVRQTRSELEELCEVVSTAESLSIIQADPDDDRVLECAVAGHADYIVTGDRHLLQLGQFRGIAIVTVRQFLDRQSPSA
jgi:putative PIN family toxin of toxin-antitoxin system